MPMTRSIACLLALLLPVAAWAEAYRVGTNDILSVRVAVWDELNAVVSDMPGVSGDYPVGADGVVLLPMAGAIDVADRTPGEIAQAIETAMVGYVGIGQSAKAGVSVGTYAPIYVSGQVENPGVHPFAPGMTVQMAMSLAGGAGAADPIEGQERNFLSARGSINALQRELMFLTAKRERLLLEIGGGDAAPDLSDIDPEAWAAEDAILQARNARYDHELRSLARARASLAEATAVLEVKLEKSRAQVEAGQAELQREKDLVERGLVAPVRVFERESYVTDLESRLLDIERAVVFAQQQMQDLERNEGLLLALRDEENATTLQQVEANIAQIDAQLASQYALLSAAAGLQVGQLPGLDPLTAEISYTITRTRGGSEKLDADKATVLLPGDVIEVSLVDQTTLAASN